METNLNSLTVSANGRVSFSGLSSGIDFESAVDSIIAAKRIPVDRLETRITENNGKIAAYQEFRSNLNVLKDSLKNLYGAVTADNSRNIFEAKEAFASARRLDGGTASAPSDLLGVTVTNKAAVGSHTLEVVQTAASHRVGSGVLSSRSADLGTARGLPANSVSGAIEIAGKSIDVLSTDSLQDLADRINNANTGKNATGVSASIVQVGSSQFLLNLKVDQAGQTLGTDVSLNDPDGILQQLGVRDGGGNFANELQAARKAQFYADGVLDGSKYASAAQASSTNALGLTGGISFTDNTGAAIDSIAYAAGDSMEAIRDAINGNANLAAAGISATIDSSGGTHELRISGSAEFSMSDSGSALSTLGVTKEPLLIERSTNTFSDLFAGVTINLFKAEPGTTVQVDVERNLGQVKTAISGFVDAYNEVRSFLNYHLDPDPATGEPKEDAVLFGSRALADVETRLGQILGDGATGVGNAFTVLAQIGVKFVDNNSLQDLSNVNTLEIDSDKLDEALLNNLSDVKKLFGFSFSSSDPRVVMLGFSGSTSYSASGYQLSIDYDEGGATLGSATVSSGTASVKGSQITVDSGGAKGLKLFYSGNSDVANIQLDFSVGVGAQMFFELDKLLDSKAGTVETEIKGLTTNNESSQSRIDEMLVRIDLQRESMLQRFISMESSLATMNRILESVGQITDAMFADKG